VLAVETGQGEADLVVARPFFECRGDEQSDPGQRHVDDTPLGALVGVVRDHRRDEAGKTGLPAPLAPAEDDMQGVNGSR